MNANVNGVDAIDAISATPEGLTMYPEIARIVREIEIYCRRAGIPESRFGLLAAGDAKKVVRLRAKNDAVVSTLHRLRDFMKSNPPESVGGLLGQDRDSKGRAAPAAGPQRKAKIKSA